MKTLSAVPKMTSDLPYGSKERRSGTDRRQFSYAAHIPERRSGKDRRKPRIRKKREQTADQQFRP
ncbi:MAG: hypothetical protein QNJ48_03270 [Desulfobacterales bacterium]|nr:hypothetical protein [Desulfobacterales bacterium]MDJ0875073.1 hypothetical protein [Desulfobacterales bacterium]MDJ0883150.1 hypothetical protein [Desulfobacterales bacterium]